MPAVKTKKKGPLALPGVPLKLAAIRWTDGFGLHGERLRNIEERLSRLDGGPSGDRAIVAAYRALVVKRAEAGLPAPCMKIDADGRVVFTEVER